MATSDHSMNSIHGYRVKSRPDQRQSIGECLTRMYPDLFHVGSFEVTTFGAMVAAGALVGLWLFDRELTLRRLPHDALNGAAIGVIAGMIGAKLLFVFEHRGEEPVL